MAWTVQARDSVALKIFFSYQQPLCSFRKRAAEDVQKDHELFPQLLEWTQYKIDKSMNRELGERYRRHEATLHKFSGCSAELKKRCADELAAAVQLALEHHVRTAELEELNGRAQQRIEYAKCLADRQRSATQLLYQPNRHNQEERKAHEERIRMAIQKQAGERANNDKVIGFVNGQIEGGRVNEAQRELLIIQALIWQRHSN